MKSLGTRRPSPAMIVALVALMVALGGTGYAALKLPKNSVGAKQLKKNAVTKAKIKKNAVNGAKVKNKSLTGSDINLDKLGTVPSAAHATSADTAAVASTTAPIEAPHIVGAPGEPPFEGGSGNFVAEPGIPYGFNPVSFYKDHFGIVHLEGVAQVGESPMGFVFTLPPGFRPASGKVVPWNLLEENAGGAVFGSNVFVEGIGSLDGKVIGNAGETLILDGLTFKAGS